MTGFKLDGTISLGHLLTAITLLISVVAAYYSLREDIRANSIRIEHIERIIERDIKAMNASINSIRELMEMALFLVGCATVEKRAVDAAREQKDVRAINKSIDRMHRKHP